MDRRVTGAAPRAEKSLSRWVRDSNEGHSVEAQLASDQHWQHGITRASKQVVLHALMLDSELVQHLFQPVRCWTEDATAPWGGSQARWKQLSDLTYCPAASVQNNVVPVTAPT